MYVSLQCVTEFFVVATWHLHSMNLPHLPAALIKNCSFAPAFLSWWPLSWVRWLCMLKMYMVCNCFLLLKRWIWSLDTSSVSSMGSTSSTNHHPCTLGSKACDLHWSSYSEQTCESNIRMHCVCKPCVWMLIHFAQPRWEVKEGKFPGIPPSACCDLGQYQWQGEMGWLLAGGGMLSGGHWESASCLENTWKRAWRVCNRILHSKGRDQYAPSSFFWKNNNFGSWSGQSMPSSQGQRLSVTMINSGKGHQEPTAWH